MSGPSKIGTLVITPDCLNDTEWYSVRLNAPSDTWGVANGYLLNSNNGKFIYPTSYFYKTRHLAKPSTTFIILIFSSKPDVWPQVYSLTFYELM